MASDYSTAQVQFTETSSLPLRIICIWRPSLAFAHICGCQSIPIWKMTAPTTTITTTTTTTITIIVPPPLPPPATTARTVTSTTTTNTTSHNTDMQTRTRTQTSIRVGLAASTPTRTLPMAATPAKTLATATATTTTTTISNGNHRRASIHSPCPSCPRMAIKTTATLNQSLAKLRLLRHINLHRHCLVSLPMKPPFLISKNIPWTRLAPTMRATAIYARVRSKCRRKVFTLRGRNN
mmetsp:Transcript_52428/g.86779  ORF Transcript_52428/g.86779 Transcript_52428/m.86779 type:complete len:237 (+) Transcript_52428:779-1489(+)